MYEGWSYEFMRPPGTSVCGLKPLVYDASTYRCMTPEATSVCDLKILEHAAVLGKLEYSCMRP